MERWLDPQWVARYVERARAAGHSDSAIQQHVAARQLEAQRESEKAKVRPMDVLRSLGQGATFDFLDEIGGAGAALIPGGQGYTERRDEIRANDEAFRAAHPKLDTGLRIGGGLVTAAIPAAGAARAVQGLGAARSLGAAARTGAAFGAAGGAAQGLGSSTADLTQGNVGGAAADAAIGAAGGAALGAGIPLAGRPLAWFVKKLTGLGHSPSAALREARELLAMAVDESRGGEAAVVKRLTELEQMRPGMPVLADASPSLGRYADYATSVAPRVTDLVEETLTRRAQGAGERMATAVDQAVGGRPSMRAGQRQAKQELQQLGREVYDPLRARGDAVQNEALDEILTRPEIADMVPPLKRRAQAGGREFVPIVEKVNTPNGFTWQRTGEFPDFDLLQSLKIRLDGKIKNLRQNGFTGEAMDLEKARADLIAALEQSGDGYVEANARYGSKLAEVKAFVDGFRALDLDSEAVRDALEAARRAGGEPAVKAFRTGMLDKLAKRLRSVQEGHDAATRYANMGSELRDRLRAAFPSQEAFEKFMRNADVERDFMRTSRAVGGRSPTQPRQAMDALVGAGVDEGNLIAAGATGGVPGAAMSLASRFLRGGSQDMRQGIANEMGEALLARPWQEVLEQIAEARARGTSRIRRNNAALAGAATGGFGLLDRLFDVVE